MSSHYDNPLIPVETHTVLVAKAQSLPSRKITVLINLYTVFLQNAISPVLRMNIQHIIYCYLELLSCKHTKYENPSLLLSSKVKFPNKKILQIEIFVF